MHCDRMVGSLPGTVTCWWCCVVMNIAAMHVFQKGSSCCICHRLDAGELFADIHSLLPLSEIQGGIAKILIREAGEPTYLATTALLFMCGSEA